MLTVATVLRRGPEFKPRHVHALWDGVSEHLEAEHEFVCLTDEEGVQCETIPLEHGWVGWWSKLELFKLAGPVLYFDLDTVVRGPIDAVVDALNGRPFAILRDFYQSIDRMGSGMMYWEDDRSWIYESFLLDPQAAMRRYRGDQNFLDAVVKDADFMQDITDGVCSYKADVRRKTERAGAPIVCFHGRPRPWSQDEIPYGQ